MSVLFSSLIIKKSFENGTLCECQHRKLDHVLLNSYGEMDGTKSRVDFPQVLCVCGCIDFKLITNLKYLELLHENTKSSEGKVIQEL